MSQMTSEFCAAWFPEFTAVEFKRMNWATGDLCEVIREDGWARGFRKVEQYANWDGSDAFRLIGPVIAADGSIIDDDIDSGRSF